MQARPQGSLPESSEQKAAGEGARAATAVPQLYGGCFRTTPLTPPMDIIGALSVILIVRVTELSLWDIVRDRRSPVG